MNVIKFPVKLAEPKTEIEEIAYQTVLPYYDPDLINQYNRVSPGMGDRVLEMLKKEISHLENSKKIYEALNKLSGKRLFTSWRSHLAYFGWNVSGKYQKNSDLP